jgi:hypothetical protein
VAPGWLDPYIVEHYQLEVENDGFNGMEMSCLVACHAALGQQCDVMLSSRVDTIMVLGK